MRKAEFTQAVVEGVNRNRRFMVVKTETDGSIGAEITITPSENFTAKLAYYDRFYNDNMQMVVSSSLPGAGKVVSVTDVLMTSNLNDLNWFAY